MKKMLVLFSSVFAYASCNAMSLEPILSKSKIYDWEKIASVSPMSEEPDEVLTYAFSDKSKVNFSIIESNALKGSAVAQYCMFDALINLSVDDICSRRAYYEQAIHFLILSSCKGKYWKSEEELNFYLSWVDEKRDLKDINPVNCEDEVKKLLAYFMGA